ncbi:MAG: hypothetical protein Q8M98_05945 [Candidatus Cloacimonadaceae bacterium]|nr:hypothetical protein [Candidatus Cloacimonadaceae bacterium]
MPIIDRMLYPRNRKLKEAAIFLVLIGAIFGIWLNAHGQRALQKRVIIHSVAFENYGSQFIEIGYEIENKGNKNEEVRLLAKIYDARGDEIASSMFLTTVNAKSRQQKSKLMDKLNRSLKPGEKPYRATLEIYTRKVI